MNKITVHGNPSDHKIKCGQMFQHKDNGKVWIIVPVGIGLKLLVGLDGESYMGSPQKDIEEVFHSNRDFYRQVYSVTIKDE